MACHTNISFLSSRGSCMHKWTSTMYMYLSLIVLRFSFPSCCAHHMVAFVHVRALYKSSPSFFSWLNICWTWVPHSQCEGSRSSYSTYHTSTSSWSPQTLLKRSWGRQPCSSASILTQCWNTHVHAWSADGENTGRGHYKVCPCLSLALVLYHLLSLDLLG